MKRRNKPSKYMYMYTNTVSSSAYLFSEITTIKFVLANVFELQSHASIYILLSA